MPATLPPPPFDLLKQASLFLDFDGTLVELGARPDAISVEENLRELLSRLTTRLSGRLAIVSGRPASQVQALFGDVAFAIGGSHGVELHWPDGRVISPAATADIPAVLNALADLERRFPGVLVEKKPFGLALHYRLAPGAEDECIRLASRIAADEGYTLQKGKMVVELKTATGDKGAAVLAFMAESPMTGTRPFFIGDDDTDEAGFAISTRLGGAGVLVGPPRQTVASYRLPGVSETLNWLEAACERLP